MTQKPAFLSCFKNHSMHHTCHLQNTACSLQMTCKNSTDNVMSSVDSCFHFFGSCSAPWVPPPLISLPSNPFTSSSSTDNPSSWAVMMQVGASIAHCEGVGGRELQGIVGAPLHNVKKALQCQGGKEEELIQ